MKNFRSSKNLRAIDPSSKEESALRMKVKSLQQQIELLQKSNLNIFIPLSEHDAKNTPNFQAIINKLKTQILGLQQEVQRQKGVIKKLESEKEVLRINHQNEKMRLQENIQALQADKESLTQQVASLEEQIESQREKRAQAQKINIELKVQNRFLSDDISNLKKRLSTYEKKYEDLHSLVLGVTHYSRIYNSKQSKVIAIEAAELNGLKKYIEQLESKLKEMMEANRQEKITLGVPRKNIGEEIVRLKKNIDMQLGLPVNQQSTHTFLQVYKGTTACFDELIRECKR